MDTGGPSTGQPLSFGKTELDLEAIQSTCKSITMPEQKTLGSVLRVRDDMGLQPGMEIEKRPRKKKKHGELTKKQQKLVEEHLWVAGRLAYSAICRTGNQTGCFTYDDLNRRPLCVVCCGYTI